MRTTAGVQSARHAQRLSISGVIRPLSYVVIPASTPAKPRYQRGSATHHYRPPLVKWRRTVAVKLLLTKHSCMNYIR
ncbi:hypothetical protein E2C01_063475 [Portunus trituberculatus]|uniref:Uncharacterized protein n=1 Tax=Portunus trituberculatus TaxID=210409 RepID=A0A5B7HKK3_PORTR|nr:hypothetical protein [Portunus trituberculatus]